MRKSQPNIFDMLSSKIDQEFESYDRKHPQVYVKFKEVALRLIEKGRHHYSADAILHVIRYETAIQKDVLELFKINNNFSSRYARKFMQENPQHTGFFETRVLKPL